jgi:hypothetical protein
MFLLGEKSDCHGCFDGSAVFGIHASRDFSSCLAAALPVKDVERM